MLVSRVYGSYKGGFSKGTTAGIARRLGAGVHPPEPEPDKRTEKRRSAAIAAWLWYDARDEVWRRKVEEAVSVQINRLFPKLEPPLLQVCLGHLHDALFGVADRERSLKKAAHRHYEGGLARCKQQ